MTEDQKQRVLDVLGGGDGVPAAEIRERIAILSALRDEVLHAIHVCRERYRVAKTLKNEGAMKELEEITGRNLVSLDTLDGELAGLPK